VVAEAKLQLVVACPALDKQARDSAEPFGTAADLFLGHAPALVYLRPWKREEFLARVGAVDRAVARARPKG
jgi:hypothetical protein